jgi:hypothetical protein
MAKMADNRLDLIRSIVLAADQARDNPDLAWRTLNQIKRLLVEPDLNQRRVRALQFIKALAADDLGDPPTVRLAAIWQQAHDALREV